MLMYMYKDTFKRVIDRQRADFIDSELRFSLGGPEGDYPSGAIFSKIKGDDMPQQWFDL